MAKQKKFLVDKSYQFGQLRRGSDHLVYPEFTRTLTRKGKYFKDLGTPDVRTYLTKNPDGWDPQKIVYFYEVDPQSGTLLYFDHLTPLPKEEPKEQGHPVPALADNFRAPGPTVNVPDQGLADMLQDNFAWQQGRVEYLEQRLSEKDQEISQLQHLLAQANAEKIQAQQQHAKLLEMRQMRETMEKEVEKELAKADRAQSQGMGDPMQLLNALMTMIGQGNSPKQPGFQGLNGIPPQQAPPGFQPQQAQPQQAPSRPAPPTSIQYATNVQEGE